MNAEEIIKILRLIQAAVEWDYPMEYSAAIDAAIEILEKETPIHPLHYEMDIGGRVIIPCGNCGSGLDGNEEYCKWCGQKVKWT